MEERYGWLGVWERTRKSYIYGNYIDEPVVMNIHIGRRIRRKFYYLHNSQYSVVALTDKRGRIVERYLYTPYGDVTVLDSRNRILRRSRFNDYLFTGRRYDWGTGLYYFRNRYYEPVKGRFIQRDIFEARINKGYIIRYIFEIPWNINLYVYADNSPESRLDPLGLFTWSTENFGSNKLFGVVFCFSEETCEADENDVCCLKVDYAYKAEGISLKECIQECKEKYFLTESSLFGGMVGAGWSFGLEFGCVASCLMPVCIETESPKESYRTESILGLYYYCEKYYYCERTEDLTLEEDINFNPWEIIVDYITDTYGGLIRYRRYSVENRSEWICKGMSICSILIGGIGSILVFCGILNRSIYKIVLGNLLLMIGVVVFIFSKKKSKIWEFFLRTRFYPRDLILICIIFILKKIRKQERK